MFRRGCASEGCMGADDINKAIDGAARGHGSVPTDLPGDPSPDLELSRLRKNDMGNPQRLIKRRAQATAPANTNFPIRGMGEEPHSLPIGEARDLPDAELRRRFREIVPYRRSNFDDDLLPENFPKNADQMTRLRILEAIQEH